MVPLHGIRIAMGLSLLAAAGFLCFAYLGDKQWHEQNPGSGAGDFVTPLWMWILRIALPLVPFFLSVLLLSTRSENSKAAGAGIAVALFSSGLLFAIAALFSLIFMQFFAVPYILQELIASFTFLACSIWILVSAFRIGKASWGIFLLTLAATLICLIWGNHALDAATYKLEHQQEQRKAQTAGQAATNTRGSTSAEAIGPIVPTITEFEQVVREYKLSPDQYLRSTRLREWARRNKNSKYIPEPLLEAWGFEIESTL